MLHTRIARIKHRAVNYSLPLALDQNAFNFGG